MSGSMNGFKGSMVKTVLPWIRDSIQHLIPKAKGEFCILNSRIGVRCYELTYQLKEENYVATGNTNIPTILNEKVEGDVDFIILITDGVGYVASKVSEECGEGVNIACFAQSLNNTMSKISAEPVMFFLPLVLPYDGIHYTEERMGLEEFINRAIDNVIIKNVKEDTGIKSVSVYDPRVDKDGLLNYKYKGPRPLLLIVMGKKSNLTRNLSMGLFKKAKDKGFKATSSLRNVKSLEDLNTSPLIFPIIEIFPGYPEEIKWNVETNRRVSPITTSRGEDCEEGNMEIIYGGREEEDVESFIINCNTSSEWGFYQLEKKELENEGFCENIFSPVAFKWNLKPDIDIKRGIRFKESRDGRMWYMYLECEPIIKAKEINIEITMDFDFDTITKCIYNIEKCSKENESYEIIKNLSAENIIYYPHRILQFKELIEGIYRAAGFQSYKRIGRLKLIKR
jgi:hypothetical protein